MTSDTTSPKPARKKLEVPLYVPPARQAAQGQAVSLPQVVAPSLEGLAVTVASSEGFTAEQVKERFQELARPYATERMRSLEEQLAWGDEVLLNIIGYSQGHLLPFSVRTNVWLPLEPDSQLPGFYETLVGRAPRQSVVMDLTLPRDYPIEALRGTPARFMVDVQAAREVTYLEPESAQFLQAFGRGATLGEAMRSVVQQMQNEYTQLLLLQAQQQVLDEVATRTQGEIPAPLIDEEIRRRWGASEGKSLMELNLSDEEQQESLSTWLKDTGTRAEAERRLRIALALGAICKRDGLTLTPEVVEKVLRAQATAAGLTMEEAAAALRAEPQQLSRIDQAAWHLMAVDHVMSKAQLRFGGA